MKITIDAQHLTGNEPEDFNTKKWVSALEQEYRDITVANFPDAEIEIKIDIQRASGYSREVQVYCSDDSADITSLTFQIEQASNALYNSRGQEFFNETE